MRDARGFRQIERQIMVIKQDYVIGISRKKTDLSQVVYFHSEKLSRPLSKVNFVQTCLCSNMLVHLYKDETSVSVPPQRGYVCRGASGETLRGRKHRLRVIRGTKTGWVPVGTEEEERRLSNSEKSSLDVPLDVLNRSKLPERRQTHSHKHVFTHKDDNTQRVYKNYIYSGNKTDKCKWITWLKYKIR